MKKQKPKKIGITVSVTVDRLKEIEETAILRDINFSQASDYLLKMGYLYVSKVLASQAVVNSEVDPDV